MAAQQYAQQQQQQYSQSPQYTPVAAAQQPYPPAAYSNAAAPSNDPAEMLLLQFPSTAKLTRDDLEEALRSPAYFDALFGTLPQAKAMYDEHEQHLVRNEQATGASCQTEIDWMVRLIADTQLPTWLSRSSTKH